jgi:hypothetical protein
VLGALLFAPATRAAEPDGFRPCDRALKPSQVKHLFEELKDLSGRDGCKLEDVHTRLGATRVTWSRKGAMLPPVLIAPSGCLRSPNLDGAELQASVPPTVERSCPTSYAKLRTLIGRPVGTLVLTRQQGASGAETPVPAAGLTVGVFALALLLALLLLLRSFLGRERRERGEYSWLFVAASGLGIALLLRLSVQPALANWYAEVLPASGALGSRFGPGFLVLQRVVSTLLPWSDTTLFTVNAVIGALAVPIAVAIARERRLPITVGAALGVLFALAPLHVRISASASQHVLASTLTLTALWLWLRAERLGSKLHAALALVLLAAVALTRAEAWVQLLAIAVWGFLRDPEEPASTASQRRRLSLVFLGAWAAIGLVCYFLVVVPSHHPMPDADGIRSAASQLILQYPDVAFSPPHWVSPLAVLLAVPGGLYLLVNRWRLLAGIAIYLALAFVPLGRTLQHDGLLGARYFLATIPLFLMLSACGLFVCGRSVVWALGLVPRLARAAWLQPALTALLFLAAGLGDLALAAPAYRARYTFQDEYAFLRRDLARVPDGCSVVSLPLRASQFNRDLDCCLDIHKSPLSLAYPRLHLLMAASARDLEGPGCRYYYESAACSIDLPPESASPVDRPALEFLRRACAEARKKTLSQVAGARVSPRTTNRYFRHGPPEVRLLRMRPQPRGQR